MVVVVAGAVLWFLALRPSSRRVAAAGGGGSPFAPSSWRYTSCSSPWSLIITRPVLRRFFVLFCEWHTVRWINQWTFRKRKYDFAWGLKNIFPKFCLEKWPNVARGPAFCGKVYSYSDELQFYSFVKKCSLFGIRVVKQSWALTSVDWCSLHAKICGIVF